MTRSFALRGLALVVASASATAQPIGRASVDSNGVEGNAASFAPAISDNGRFVAFVSAATNLALGDRNGADDVFVRDRLVGITELVSATPSGAPGDGPSGRPVLSANGRWVAFQSFSSDLVFGDRNGQYDVFVRDRATGETARISGGAADADGFSAVPAISASGRYVAFLSVATNLVADDTNGYADAFVRDRRTGVTRRVSVRSDFGQADGPSFSCAISGDGRYVAFVADAPSLAPPGPTGRFRQLFLHDRVDGTTTLVSAASGQAAAGHSDNPVLSGDGGFLAFESDAELASGAADPTRDVFVFDRATTATLRASVGPRGQAIHLDCRWPAISADGRYVAFNATNDALLYDREIGRSAVVSVDASGVPVGSLSGDGGSSSRGLALSRDAGVVAYNTFSSSLVPGDANGAEDVVAYRRTASGTLTVETIAPSSGTRTGGDVTRLWGSGFGTLADTTVRFGTVGADVIEVASNRLVVRTPPGFGVADVVVVSAGATIVVPHAYRFMEPASAARFGNVNLGRGDRESPLTVNDSAGDADRVLSFLPRDPMSLRVATPSSRAQSAFALYAWIGEPTAATLSNTRRRLGDTVFPTPLVGRTPQPRAIWNNIGIVRTLGAPSLPASLAPTTVAVAAGGVRGPLTLTLQGIVQDSGSRIFEGFSVTNAIVVRVR